MNPTNPKAGHFPKKYSTSYVFNDTISRLFIILAELHNIEELNQKTLLPYLFTNKPTPLTFNYRVGEITSLEYSKKITWILESKNVPSPIHYTFTLTLNTLNNTTLLEFEILITQPEKIEVSKRDKIRKGCLKVCCEMINNIDTLLQINNDNIYDYGSNIIQAPIEKVWDYVTHFKFMKNDYIKELSIEGNPEEPGAVLTWTVAKDGEKWKSKVSHVSKSSKKKKWKYKIVPMEGSFLMQEIYFIFIKLSENSTFFSVFHEFKEQVSAEVMSSVSKKKLYLLSMIKVAVERNNNQ